MKVIHHASKKFVSNDGSTILYQKDEDCTLIPIYQANQARALGSLVTCGVRNDTDDIPEEIIFEGRRHRPVVCAPPHIPGQYIGGYIDVDRDTLCLCEHPVENISHAARCAFKMVTDPQSDDFDIVRTCKKAA